MKTYRLLYIATAALLLASCANDDESLANKDPVAATIKADIAGNQTRGTADTNQWTAGDAIGVYATSTGVTSADNKKYVASDAIGNFSAADNNNTIYFRDTKEVTFSAYYPYSETLSGGLLNWSMAEVTAGSPCTADVLYASGATASKASPNVDFNGTDHRFKHCMSLVKFIIEPTSTIIDTSNNIIKSVTLDNIYTAATFNTVTGATTAVGSKRQYERTFNNIPLSADAGQRSFEVIMLPQSRPASDPLTVSIGIENEFNVVNTYSATLTQTFNAGYMYTYTIKVQNTSIYISNASIAAWETGGSSTLEAQLN